MFEWKNIFQQILEVGWSDFFSSKRNSIYIFFITDSETGWARAFFVLTCVAAVMETTKLGTDEQERLTRRPSASSTMRLPPGQMM